MKDNSRGKMQSTIWASPIQHCDDFTQGLIVFGDKIYDKGLQGKLHGCNAMLRKRFRSIISFDRSANKKTQC